MNDSERERLFLFSIATVVGMVFLLLFALLCYIHELAPTGSPGLRYGRWYSVGPFASTSIDQAFDPEREEIVDLGAVYGEKGERRWVPHEGLANGEPYPFEYPANSTFYLYRTVQASTEETVQLIVCDADGLKIWLNGRPLFTRGASARPASGQDRVPARLVQGANTILVKVLSAHPDCRFSFRVEHRLSKAPFAFAVFLGLCAFLCGCYFCASEPAGRRVSGDEHLLAFLGKGIRVFVADLPTVLFRGGRRLPARHGFGIALAVEGALLALLAIAAWFLMGYVPAPLP